MITPLDDLETSRGENMPAYSIISEEPIDGYDLFGQAEALAAGNDLLDRLASAAGVPPLMEFFTMEPEEVDALFDLLALDASSFDSDEDGVAEPTSAVNAEELSQSDEAPPVIWFDAETGLVTVRALLQALQDQADPESPDDPPQALLLTDLREFETILNLLAAKGVRWHLGVDF